MPEFPTNCEVEWVDAEDPLFLLYTSGSTGKPKVISSQVTENAVYAFDFYCYLFMLCW